VAFIGEKLSIKGKPTIIPLHEPTHPQPLPRGEQAFVPVLSVPLLGGVRGGFMVPMHGTKVEEALHEPVWVTDLSDLAEEFLTLTRTLTPTLNRR